VLAVMDQDDRLIKRFNQLNDIPFTDALLAVTLDGMTKTPKIGTARAAQAVFPKLNFAAKTGTSNQQKDSWYIGVTGDYSSTVWLGDDNNVPLSITGSSGAQKVWIDFTQHTNPVSLPDSLPYGAARFDVLDSKFEIAADRCEDKISLAFILGTEPKDSTSCFWPF